MCSPHLFCFSYRKIKELKHLVSLSVMEKDERIKTYLDKKSKGSFELSLFLLKLKTETETIIAK